jgi:post-segregation antitoxin (ccd killing protein)
MTMGTQASHDDDMPTEIDFSKGTRAKFFRAGANLSLPVYLEADVQDYLAARAKARGIEVGQLVNELLKKDIELIEAVR